MTLTDPTGYFNFRRFWNKTGRTVAAIVVTIYTSGAAAAATSATQATAWVFAGGFAAGGISSGNIKGAIKGAVFAIVANGLGGLSDVKRISGHLALSGVDSVLSGDKFGHGVVSAGIGMIGGYATSGLGDDWGSLFAGTLVNAMVSGTASEIAGGKFATGALSGALRYAFNDVLHPSKEYKSLKNKELKAWEKIDKFKKNNPGKPIPVSESDFFDISLGSLADINIDSFPNNPYFDKDIQTHKADTNFFDDAYRDELFLLEGLDTNNGKGVPGSYVNYIGIGMFTQRGGLDKGSITAMVTAWNLLDIAEGKPVSYNLKQIPQGIYWGEIGYNFAQNN